VIYQNSTDPGSSMKYAAAATVANTATTSYKVRGGDSLWKIARKFNVQTDDIKRWNNLKDNLIHPGLELLLKEKS
jgi:LysM repeat protein